MAFNFNWSPLIADTDRVRDMLTSSLNKSPKPPIIVDDIVVNELNLGSTPPELEILEIGDLAEDRFRGIFKMSYTGDAYLTIKTKVQANPLKTFLSTKPSFTSPQPLAAASGLTIPLQITLSDIRLSGFVILVFSKQKGITLVFRNDPLESLKVSSTFDSIPFIRNYLQKTIESQLRVLVVEDLPAIIHRLSLKLFSPDHQIEGNQEPIRKAEDESDPIDPLTDPATRIAEDERASIIDTGFTADSPAELYASFSQKNLLRLAALSDSQRTLSLFTPSIRDTVYRAWASTADRDDVYNGSSTPVIRPPTLSRLQSSAGLHGWSSSASHTSETTHSTKPSLVSQTSTSTVHSLSGGNRSRPPRKRKNRIVNLRKDRGEHSLSDVASVSSGYPESVSQSASGSAGPSAAATEPSSIPSSNLRHDGEIITPPRSPHVRSDTGGKHNTIRRARVVDDIDATPKASTLLRDPVEARIARPGLPRAEHISNKSTSDLPRSMSELSLRGLSGASLRSSEGSTGSILEQAWMMKVANEVARKMAEEKGRRNSWRDEQDIEAPPAYVS